MIGGGATGAGVAWDAALRGFNVILADRADLAEGTSGRFHGLLHSGGRYVVKDPIAADECVAENAILRRMIPDCIEDTGGLFVTTPDDDPAYADQFLEGARRAAMPAEEIPVAEALRTEPRLNPRIRRAIRVQDGSIEVWKTVWSLARGAQEHGARILTYHKVIDLHRADGAVTGARLRNELTGEELDVETRFVAERVRAVGGADRPHGRDRGHRRDPRQGDHDRDEPPAREHGDQPVRHAGRRRHPRADPDGQRDRHDGHQGRGSRRDPGDAGRGRRDARRRRAARPGLPPGARAARLGGRAPAVPGREGRPGGEDTRDVSRTHAVVDHRARDGVDGLLTMSGGKLTTYRLMAQDLVDAMCRQLGDERPCTTAETAPPGNEGAELYSLGSRLRRREETLQDEQLICECELIGRSRLEETMRERGSTNLDDIRRSLRLGMGPCQGGFCIYRATGILHGVGRLDGAQASESLRGFLAGALEGLVADPLRRPAAPGAPRRLDLPGAARRGARAA